MTILQALYTERSYFHRTARTYGDGRQGAISRHGGGAEGVVIRGLGRCPQGWTGTRRGLRKTGRSDSGELQGAGPQDGGGCNTVRQVVPGAAARPGALLERSFQSCSLQTHLLCSLFPETFLLRKPQVNKPAQATGPRCGGDQKSKGVSRPRPSVAGRPPSFSLGRIQLAPLLSHQLPHFAVQNPKGKDDAS